MITAKNLQLLDTQGNNISPAVNIETIYYEQTVGNVVHRNHIFKHFPVYVKYNGKPTVNYTGTILVNDTFYKNTVLPYEKDQTWPALADVTKTEIYTDPKTFDPSLGGNVRLLEFSTATPNDIYVAGIRQTPLGNGTDFMRLDISTYNLSSILAPVAYKEWVNVRLDYYNTKIENNNIYRSELRNLVNRKQLNTLHRVGSLSKGTSFDSSLNGLTYTELFDKILIGPENPKVSDLVLDISVNKDIYVSESQLTAYHNDVKQGRKTYTYKEINSTVLQTYTMSLSNVQYPKWNTFGMNGEVLTLPNIIDGIRARSSYNNITVLEAVPSSKTFIKTTGVGYLNIPWNLHKLIKQKELYDIIPSIKYHMIAADDPSTVLNSIGNPLHQYSTLDGLNNMIKEHKPNVIVNINGILRWKATLPQITDATAYKELCNTATNDKVQFETLCVKFPIKYGSSMSSLKRVYVDVNEFNKIEAYWNPVKPFYICVPRILACQLINPFPELHRVFQGSKWVLTNNWTIGSIMSVEDGRYKENGRPVSLAPYLVYKIDPVGCGATRHILFSINLAGPNLLVHKDEMQSNSVGGNTESDDTQTTYRR